MTPALLGTVRFLLQCRYRAVPGSNGTPCAATEPTFPFPFLGDSAMHVRFWFTPLVIAAISTALVGAANGQQGATGNQQNAQPGQARSGQGAGQGQQMDRLLVSW